MSLLHSDTQEDVLLSAAPWGSIAAQIPSIWLARCLSSSLLLQIVILTHVLFNILVPVAAVHIGYAAVFVLRVLIGISHVSWLKSNASTQPPYAGRFSKLKHIDALDQELADSIAALLGDWNLNFQAFFAVAVYSLIDKWFPRFERSTALAVFYLGGQIAGIVGGPLTGFICASSLGWQTNFYIMSELQVF